MATFVDTSALFALLAVDSESHSAAARALSELRGQERLVTHNYVAVEATALVGRRLGRDAVRALHERFMDLIELVWVDERTHSAAVSALLAAGQLSLVDLVSFEVMRRQGLETAFAFDRDFRRHGFATVP